MKKVIIATLSILLGFSVAAFAGDTPAAPDTTESDASQYITPQDDTTVQTPAGLDSEDVKPIDASEDKDQEDLEKEDK